MRPTTALRTWLGSIPVIPLLCGATPVLAATYVVDQGGSGDFQSIQDAIEFSTHGDVIEVHPGTYYESLFYGGRRITVRSTEGPEVTVLDGEGSHTLARFVFGEPRSAVLEGFTLQNGRGTPLEAPGPAGPAPDLSEHPRAGLDPRLDALREDAAREGTAGGAILCAAGHPTLRNLVFRDNFANDGGALFALTSVPLLDHCHFENNLAGRGGAIVGVYSAVQIVHNEFHDNSAVFGGALYLEDSPVEVHMSVFHGHVAKQGGAWYALGSGTVEATVHHTAFSHNGASLGHAIASLDHPIVIHHDVFYENRFEDFEAATLQFDGKYAGGSVLNSIFFGDPVGEHLACGPAPLEVSCNDFFPGPLPACAPAADNFTADPLLCAPEDGDFSVRTDSPCLPGEVPEGCGFVGIHLEPGCLTPYIDVRSILEDYHARVRAARPQ